jgi:hypothetical protein
MKKVFSIVAGVITGFAIVFIGDATSHAMNPPPLGLNYMDKNVMMDYVAKIPTYVLVIMVIFWLASSFLGGLVSALIQKTEWKRNSLTTGAILMAAAILNLIMITHPVWMWITVLAGYLPAALLGGWLMRPKTVSA